VRDEPEQVRSAEAFVTSGAWVSHLVLAETMWVLDVVYERSTAQIASALDLLLNHKNLSLQDADMVGSALEQFKRRPALGFSHCLTLEIARKAGHLPLSTFDRDLARVGGAQRLR
jgi:predicted nucleic-acid-binding protein